MAKAIPAVQIAQRIQQLVDQRQQHADALARIDQTLVSIGAALAATPATPPSAEPAIATAASPAPAPKGKKRRGRRSKFATSAEDSILAFVKQNENPTTQEIKKHWESEGRGSTADNTLSLMVKAKKLKRTPLGKGIRGSRYSLL